MVSHFTDEEDVRQVTHALRGLQFRVKLVSRRAIGYLIVDVSMKRARPVQPFEFLK